MISCPAVSKPHNEKILSMNAWCRVKIFCNKCKDLVRDSVAVQNSKKLSAEYSSTSVRYLCSCCAAVSGPLLPSTLPASLQCLNHHCFHVSGKEPVLLGCWSWRPTSPGTNWQWQMTMMTTMSQSLTTSQWHQEGTD